MAGMISARVRGGSLLETMVAMTILLVVIGITTTIFVQVTLGGGSEKQLIAHELLKKFSASTVQDHAYTDGEFNSGSFIIQRKVTSYPTFESLLKVHYLIYDSNRNLVEDWQELILQEN